MSTRRSFPGGAVSAPGPAAAEGTESRSDGAGRLCRFTPAHGRCSERRVEPKRRDLSPRRGRAARGSGLAAPRIQPPVHGVNLANRPGEQQGPGKISAPPARPVVPRSAPFGELRTNCSALRPAAPTAGASQRRWAGPSHAVPIPGAWPGHAVRIAGAEPCRAARGSPRSGAGSAGPGAERGAGRGGGPDSAAPLPFLGPLAALAPPPR